ncbi:MAG: FkbM family methyltransferase, partial [Ignavibacterium sp.]|nr:FkbM family methyltransferase [Ignavibacterium sp.]
NLSNLPYRIKQKWIYHTTKDLFEKKVAEINRNQQLIVINDHTFYIKNCELIFHRQHHSFIVDRFDQFISLLENRGLFTISGEALYYLIDGIKLYITTAEELFIINEIFIERCYAIATGLNYYVIDIGMNVGYASLFFASNPRVIHVYGYEPFNPTFSDAQLNFKMNPQLSAKITSYNIGLSDCDDERIYQYSPVLKGKNSIHRPGGVGEKITLVKARVAIAEVIARDSDSQYFIKMDCEGAEFEIFENFLQELIPSQIFGFIIEWHQQDPRPIIDILVSNNFHVQYRGSEEIGLITAFRCDNAINY